MYSRRCDFYRNIHFPVSSMGDHIVIEIDRITARRAISSCPYELRQLVRDQGLTVSLAIKIIGSELSECNMKTRRTNATSGRTKEKQNAVRSVAHSLPWSDFPRPPPIISFDTWILFRALQCALLFVRKYSSVSYVVMPGCVWNPNRCYSRWFWIR